MSANRDLAGRFRGAVIEGRYEDAQRCLGEYARAAADLKDPAALSEACGLFAWARTLTLARKAALQAEAASLDRRPRAYFPRPASHTWEMEG
ncbi:MAG: hypothetical protein ACM336_06605 [Acidobacteriota bacterium]